jgi:hypothetical protein
MALHMLLACQFTLLLCVFVCVLSSAVVLRQRLQMLAGVSSAWQSAKRLRFSSIMCVDVASRRLVEAVAERGRLGQGLFPEHR